MVKSKLREGSVKLTASLASLVLIRPLNFCTYVITANVLKLVFLTFLVTVNVSSVLHCDPDPVI